MKPGTIEVTIKGVSTVMAAICLQLANGISQWAESGEYPGKLTWMVIIFLAAGQGWNTLSSFMSGSYERWKQNGKNGTAEPPKP